MPPSLANAPTQDNGIVMTSSNRSAALMSIGPVANLAPFKQVDMHWCADGLGSRERVTRGLVRERLKDTSLDCGDNSLALGTGVEPELHHESQTGLVQAYAERRGLMPRVQLCCAIAWRKPCVSSLLGRDVGCSPRRPPAGRKASPRGHRQSTAVPGNGRFAMRQVAWRSVARVDADGLVAATDEPAQQAGWQWGSAIPKQSARSLG